MVGLGLGGRTTEPSLGNFITTLVDAVVANSPFAIQRSVWLSCIGTVIHIYGNDVAGTPATLKVVRPASVPTSAISRKPQSAMPIRVIPASYRADVSSRYPLMRR